MLTNAASSWLTTTVTTDGEPPVTPGVPQSLTAVAGDQQVTASFGPPSDDGGAPITRYRLQYRQTEGGNWADGGISGTETSSTITGLTNCTEYEFRVRARNSVAWGPWTATPNITATPVGAPCEPSLSLSPGNAQIVATWTVPISGDTISGCNVQYKQSTATGWTDQTHTGTGTSSTISSLTNDIAYDVRVGGFTTTESGVWSDVASATPSLNVTQPGVPQNLVLTPDNEQITAEWDLPANDGGATITDYDVEYRESGGSWQAWAHDDATRSATITGLTNDTEYDVRVRAENSAGDGPWSPHDSTTPVGSTTPGDSKYLTLTPGSQQIATSWNEPTYNGGSPIIDYDVEYQQTGDTEWTDWPHDSAVRNTIITGLSNSTEYAVRVRAENAVGDGPWSTVEYATTPTEPGTPVLGL